MLTHRIFRQVLIMLGAAGYVVVDSEFSTDSYIWGAIYTVIICTEMVRASARARPCMRGECHVPLSCVPLRRPRQSEGSR